MHIIALSDFLIFNFNFHDSQLLDHLYFFLPSVQTIRNNFFLNCKLLEQCSNNTLYECTL